MGALFLNVGGAFSDHDAKAAVAPRENSRGTLLAIDDDTAILSVLRPLLAAEGFNVLTAASGSKGLDLLRYCERDIRIVLLDFNMPRLNGTETLAFVRHLNPRVKVLGLTGVATELLPEEFLKGVDKVLRKPYTSAQLVGTINDVLGFVPAAALPGNS